MKPYRLFLNTMLFVSLFISSTAWTQTRMNGLVTITTTATPDKVIAEGGNIYLSSVNISGSQISSGGLDLSTATTAGTVTARENANVGLASLLLNNSSVGGVPNAVELEAVVENVTANENSRIHASTISLQGTTISGDLTVNEKIYTRAGAITAGEGAEIGLASVLLDNTQLNSLRIDTLKAEIGDLTVQQGGQAYISTLKLSGVTGGDMGFSADTKIGGPLVVAEGELLNVNSVVMENTTVSGGMSYDLTSTVHDGIEVSGDGAEVMVGGMRIGEVNESLSSIEYTSTTAGTNVANPQNDFIRPTTSLDYGYLSKCSYSHKVCVLPDGWEKVDPLRLEDYGFLTPIDPSYFNNPESGFHAELFYKKSTEEWVLGFEGTDTIIGPDGKTDVLQNTIPAIYYDNQYGSASLLAITINEALKTRAKNSKISFLKNYKLTYTGHSLGGGLASNASMHTGNRAITFNAAGLRKSTALWGKYYGPNVKQQIKANWKNKYNLIDAYYVKGDELHDFQASSYLFKDAIGRHIQLENPGGIDFSAEHGIDVVIQALEKA